MPASPPQFHVGQQFRRVGRAHAPLETVTDIWLTYNVAVEIVRVRYVADHRSAIGQPVTDHDVLETTIARGALPNKAA